MGLPIRVNKLWSFPTVWEFRLLVLKPVSGQQRSFQKYFWHTYLLLRSSSSSSSSNSRFFKKIKSKEREKSIEFYSSIVVFTPLQQYVEQTQSSGVWGGLEHVGGFCATKYHEINCEAFLELKTQLATQMLAGAWGCWDMLHGMTFTEAES